MCTSVRFSDKKGNMFFGRNLDWVTGFNENIIVTPRGYKDTKYAVIGMGIIEENTPLYFDCGNEAGFAIAGLNFPNYAKYEDAEVNDKTNIPAYVFPLYIASHFATVDEVEQALPSVAILNKAINDKYPVSMLHWMIGDGKRSIVVEYTQNGMEVFKNSVDVLTNQPGYNWHKENLRNYMNIFGAEVEKIKWGKAELTPFGTGSLMRGIPGDYYSPSRFVRVAYLNTHYPTKETEEENISRLFHTLSSVAMIDGAAAMADGKFEKTIYTGGFSAASKTYYWNTYEDLSIKSVRLSDFDINSSELAEFKIGNVI